MIHLSNEEQIRKSIGSSRQKIAGQFKDEDIMEKAIPLEEFDQECPAEKFERYAYTEVAKFKDDFMKSEGADEEVLKQNLSELKQYLVKDGDMATIVYVKEKTAPEEEEAEV